MTRPVPIVVAHRAANDRSAGGPRQPRPIRENTAAAIKAAGAIGADAVEVDVRSTRDGELVLGHDAVQWRRDGWRRRPYVVVRSRRRSLVFLAGLDDAVEAAWPTGLDLKLDVKDAPDLPAVAAWCQDRGVDLNRVSLWCRSPRRISQLASRAAFAEVALLSNTRDARRYVAAAEACGATAVSFHPHTLELDAVRAAHERGLVVYAWILDPRRHREATDLGVDGLVTDWVGEALRARG